MPRLGYACVCLCVMVAVALAPSVAAAESGGEVVGWGRNLYGQLGASFKTASGGGEENPVGALGLSDVTAITSGQGGSERAFGLALLSDGEVESWGGNSNGTLGGGSLEAENEDLETQECIVEPNEGGPAEENEEAVEGEESEFGRKVHVAGLENVTAVAAAAAHSMALLSNHTVATWGTGQDGEHGNKRGGGRCETGEPLDLAQVVQHLTGVETIASGGGADFAVQGLQEPGQRVLAWGRDLQEVLDVGGPSHTEEEQEEQEKAKWKTAFAERAKAEHCRTAERREEKGEGEAAGETYAKYGLSKAACKVDDESPLPKVGEPGKWQCYTELGLQKCSKEPRPVNGTEVEEHGVKDHVTAVSAGFAYALALYSNGTVRAWGSNEQSELGTAGTKEGGISKRAERVVGLGEGERFGPAVAIAAGAGELAGQSLALLANGKVVGWGADKDGQLGQVEPEVCQEKSACVKSPTEIPGLSNIVAISAGGGYSMALNSSGEVFAFGRNVYDRLGIGSTEESVSRPTLVKGIGPVGAIAAGELSGYALLRSGVADPAPLLTIKPEPEALTVSWSSQLPSAESETGIHVCYRRAVKKAKCPFEPLKVGKKEEEQKSYKFTGLEPEQPYVVSVSNGKKTRGIMGTPLPARGAGAPAAVTGSAAAVTQVSARLNGTVNPGGGSISSCEIEYNKSPTSSGASAQACASPGSGSTPQPVFVSATGLAPATTYYFRVDAGNAQGSSEGRWEPFTTLPKDPPTALTGPASSVTQTSATLEATVDPNGGSVSSCEIEYNKSPTSSGASTKSCGSPGSGSSRVPVSVSPAGLAPNTTYYFRVDAANAGGTGKGSWEAFTTLPKDPPAAVTGSPSWLTETWAVLEGTVNPEGGKLGSCLIEYNDSPTSVGASSAACESPGSGSSPAPVSALVTGLTPSTTYYFRVDATNPGGTSDGNWETFTTVPTPPTVVTKSASSITQASATLNGTVNPNAANVSSCEVEYNESPTSVGASTASCGSPGSGTSPVPVAASVSGLTPGTTYYFRLDASNAQGTGEGNWEAFTTLPKNPPTVVTGVVSSFTQSSATLNATVNPNGGTVTACQFEYGTDTGYGKSEACSTSPGSGTGPVAVSVSLTGLAADTTYHFRISATNAGGTSEGADETFTTPMTVEYGACVKAKSVDKHATGNYEDKNCTTANTGEGQYEWEPTPEGSHIGMNGKTRTVTLKSALVSITCQKSTSAGEITGPTTVTETVTYTGCASGTGKHAPACTSTGGSAGSIKTAVLDGSLVAEGGEVWTRYESAVTPYLEEFECAGIKYGVQGSVAAVDSCNVNLMTATGCETFAEGKGEQYLELDILGGAGEPATQTTVATLKSATKLEIKTFT